MARFSKFEVKAFTKENNLDRKGREKYACFAHRQNKHLYEQKVVNKQEVWVCKCGEIYVELPNAKKKLKGEQGN